MNWNVEETKVVHYYRKTTKTPRVISIKVQ